MVLWAPCVPLGWAGSTESQVSVGTPGKALCLRRKAEGSLSQSRVTEAEALGKGDGSRLRRQESLLPPWRPGHWLLLAEA